MKRFIALLLALTMLTLGGQGDATQLLTFIGGDEFGVQAFLPNSTANFVVNNFAPSSNDFVPADGFWTASNSVAAAPTVTTVSDTLPDGTTGNVSKAVFGSTTTGTSQFSVLTHADTNGLATFPLSFGVWAKVVSGTGTLFTSISNSAAIQNSSITNDGNWHFIQAPWTGSSNGGGAQVTLQVGINQNDPAQRTPVPSITIELTGAFFSGSAYANVPSYSDLKIGGDLATTGSSLTNVQVTEPLPAGVALRDPSKWALYAGNPIMAGDANEVWAGGGRGNPVIQPQFQSGGFYWAWNAQCFPSPNVNNLEYTGQCLYKSTDGLNWTEDTLNAPYLFLTGSNMFNPVINNPGAGFTASASGTATWTGGGCATPPVIAITTNSSGAIATAKPSPNNGLGTGSCPVNGLPTGTSWSYSGVGSPSTLATFNWNQTEGTQAAPGPARWELHPNFLPYGCSDGTNSHNFCVIYSAEDASTVGHLFMAWSDTVDGVYTPLGCAGPGTCGTTVPATVINLPSAGYNSPGTPFIFNVGGATGTNYIYVYSGRTGDTGNDYSIYTTPASKSNTTSGNTLTFLQDAGFTAVTGKDWYQPTTGTTFIDVGVFLNHCGFYEMYYILENATSPSPPWPASSPAFLQIMGEAVSSSPTGPWYQLQTPVNTTNSGDPAAIELGGKFILSSTYNAGSPSTGAGFAFLAPQGNCPSSAATAPANFVPPAITGSPSVGATLTASTGSWTGSPTGYTDQWLSGGSPISGATSSTYVPVTGDIGANLSVRVTASNATGSTPATSSTVGPVTTAGLVSCTGGTQTTSGSNIIATFTATGTSTINCSGPIAAAQILLVAPGGGASGAGGGAGGYCTTEGTPTCGLGTSVTIPSGSTTITLGTPGIAAVADGGPAGNGGSSSLGSIVTAFGGCGGGNINVSNTCGGGSVGSGGGAGPLSTGSSTGGVATVGQGHNGGNGFVSASPFPGAGGGGAGAAGTSPTVNTVAGNGGAGISNSISGSAVFYAGGGAGGFDLNSGGTGGTGGVGGGGNGNGSGAGAAGAAGTGGGGGGGGGTFFGGGGGTGQFIISCPNTVCSAL